MSWLLLLMLAAAPVDPLLNPLGKDVNPVVSKARAHDQALADLKRNIFKVDHALGETQTLISHSRNAPYLPDLQFRLAELYVEKSRYVYYLQAEQRPEGLKGPLVSPETKLIKQKAMQIYTRLLVEFPDFHDADKVTFYLAHEERELGQFDEMLKTLGQLIEKYPQSPLRLDAEQILGDYFFDKSDLVEAEKHYQIILAAPPSPSHDLARYKMGWIRVNQGKHAEAIPYFEAAAASEPIPGQDAQKALNVKREALIDLVYSYTEVRSGKGAIQYFEKLSDSRATFALVLEKLGTRYFVKQQYEFAIPAMRELLAIQSDPDLDLERSEKLYDALKAAKGKVHPVAEDIGFLVRAAVEAKVDPDRDEADRKKVLAETEEMSRDLSTSLHALAQQKNDSELFQESASAYKAYLSLFRPAKYVRQMMHNRADALFAAHEFPESARQFEELARYDQKAHDNKDLEASAYGALLAHYSTLKQDEVRRFNAFEVADARQALKLLGENFATKYPNSPHTVEVRFNIARAYYDDGQFEKSGKLFTEFALGHPTYKDASVAGHLALDSYRQLTDFKTLDATAEKLIHSRLPPTFIAEAKKILTESKSEALDELALKSSQETGDVVSGLLKVADENKGELGEKALYAAFSAAKDKHDVATQRTAVQKLSAQYPKSHFLPPMLLTLGRQEAETAHFEQAASWFEQAGQSLGTDAAAADGWLAGAKLRLGLGDAAHAVQDLDQASEHGGARKAELLALLAQANLKAGEPAKARNAADQALRVDGTNAAAAAVLAQVSSTQSLNAQQTQALATRLTKVVQGPNGQSDDGAKALWYFAEILYRQFKALPADQVEQKVAALQQMEGIYTQAASLGSAEWAVASLWRLGSAYTHLADTVDATPLPAGITPAQERQFKDAIKAQLAPIRERAEGAFKTCVQRADQLDVFSVAALGCRTRSEAPKAPFPTASSVATAAAPASLTALQHAVDTKMDAASFEQLGIAYLDAQQPARAQLSLERALELEEGRAAAHSALGYARLLQGDAMEARGEYGKALDADPTYEKARVNLASLRCRVGDVQGAKRELAVVRAPNAAQGGDVDTAWRNCK